MSKKHFIAIAATICAQLDTLKGESDCYNNLESNPASLQIVAVKNTVERLCDVFADENPRFDRARFLTACGINS